MGGAHKGRERSARQSSSRSAGQVDGSSFLTKPVTRREFIKKAVIVTAGVGLGAYAASRFLFYRGGQDMKAQSSVFRGDAPSSPWRWSKEATFFSVAGKSMMCELCPNHCVLKAGDRGICRSRANIGGKLYSLAYGNPCSANVDPIEKKPLFHFLPTSKVFSIAAAGCNLRCLNCQNWQISQSRPEDTRNAEMFPDAVVQNAKATSSASIAYTYSEPTTFYEYMYDTSAAARTAGIRNVWVTSGYIEKEPLYRLCTYLDAANVDLKSFSDAIYRRLNAGRLDPVLDTIRILHEKGVWQEITWLAVPTWTDDMDMIREGMQWIVRNVGPDCPVHFSRFHPLHKLTGLPQTPVSTLEQARRIALDEGINYAYIGNVPGHEAQSTFCPGCGSVVIRREGYSVDLSGLQDGVCSKCGETIRGVWR